ncbi:MAG TPA: HEAT repeat domain-containing protein [Candidatus Methylomirabilis sp.]|nr:HEAT repeat domain-containing protein [Candidatus Methylomirabilis sp.]
MTRPSKGAAAFLIFFGLMFFVPGLLFLFLVGSVKGSTPFGPIAGASIPLLFVVIGGGFVFAALAGYRRLKQQAAMEESNPSSPWLWRADWASHQAKSENKNREIGAWIACVLGNLSLLPFAVAMLPMLARRSDPRALIVLAFCAVGPILFVYAVRASLRHRRFGNTCFEFYSLPFSLGATLSGRIHLKLDSSAEHGIDLRLSCIRKTVTGSGNNRSTVKTVLWQADQHISSGALGVDPSGRTIPVEIAIPADAYVTDKDNPSDQVLWMLHAQADLPGIDYSDDFEVPVFKTAASSQQASTQSATSGSGFGDSWSSDAESAPISSPANPQVIISSQASGTEFYFHAFRTPSRAIFLLIFTVIWSGVVYFLFHSNAPWVFALFFGLMDLVLVLATFHVLLGTARIRVGNGEIVSTTKILGIGSTKRFPFSQVDAVVPVTSGQTAGNQGNTQYAIRLLTKDGRRYTLADEISTRQEARWIVSQVETLAGLRIDTRVQVDAPFGAASQPPQPFQTSSGVAQPGQAGAVALPGWQQRQPQSAKATIISFAVFLVVVAGLFGWQFSRMAAVRSSVNSARGNRSAASRAKQPVRSVFASPMADADVVRVMALTPQDQAEELLERAIQHDPRALQLFEQQVETWVGHIRLTDKMRQLEYRSQYSRDLRVRYASADISLTLDGWQKNDAAADMLIERARTDLRYRAAAVYFLGMLAGRGVAYDKIHPVLLNYAKHDPDASVRQWAVEGLRYLGTDEALDELFESFTQDPSDSVRQRAGCNLADCGNFTRAQRMRTVPKLIGLLSDGSRDARMHGWSLLALREITDMGLPGDAESWKDWYRDHGAEKLAEFQKLDWWQVRGDE